MPTVPRVTGPRVQTNALPGARVQGVQQPEPLDLGGVTKLAAGIYEAERQKADQVAVLAADNQLAKLETDLRTKASTLRGQAAMGATQAVTEDWEKGISEIATGLKTDRQKQAFQNRVGSRWQGLYSSVEQHAAGEARAFDKAETEASLANRITSAVNNWNNPDVIDNAMAESVAIVMDYSKRAGLGKEAKDAMMTAQVSHVHAAVLEAMLSQGKDQTATEYFNNAKDELTPKDRERVENSLQEGSYLGMAQRNVDKIFLTKDLTRTDAYAQVDQITDPKERDATRREMRARYGDADEAERKDYQKNAEAVFTYAERGEIAPAPLLAKLNATDRKTAKDYALRVRRGDPVDTDWVVYGDLKTTAATDPTAFLRESLHTYKGKLGETELKELISLQANMRAGKGGSDREMRGFRGVSEVVNTSLMPFGIASSAKDIVQRRKYWNFRRAVDEEILTWKDIHNKPEIPTEEAQKIVDRLILGMKAGTLLAKGMAGDPDEVPLDHQQMIRDAWRIKGRGEPRPDQIAEEYRRFTESQVTP